MRTVAGEGSSHSNWLNGQDVPGDLMGSGVRKVHCSQMKLGCPFELMLITTQLIQWEKFTYTQSSS